MDYRLRLHQKAEAEIGQIYTDISQEAGPIIAENHVAGLYSFLTN